MVEDMTSLYGKKSLPSICPSVKMRSLWAVNVISETGYRWQGKGSRGM